MKSHHLFFDKDWCFAPVWSSNISCIMHVPSLEKFTFFPFYDRQFGSILISIAFDLQIW